MASFERLIIAVFFLLLSAPGIQMLFPFAAEEKLHGVESENGPQFPAFQIESWLDDRFQHAADRWMSRSIGFRGHLVRTDNQINYKVFHELSSDYASPIVLGKDNFLFEKLYVDAFNNRWAVNDKRLWRVAARLAKLQHLLEERGIAFLLLISPSKAAIYPELIPERHRKASPGARAASNYERLIPLLEENGVHFFDTHKFLLEQKAASAYPVFPKGGTHWTQQTACIVAKQMMQQLNAAHPSGAAIPQVTCEPVELKKIPEPFDRDLADLANVWNPLPFYEILPYPVLPDQNTAADFSSRPRMLFVGGSFLWSIFYYLDAEHIYRARDMLYYYKRRFRFPENSIDDIDNDSLNWRGDVFANDVIVLEVNEASIHRIGSGFIGDALAELERH